MLRGSYRRSEYIWEKSKVKAKVEKYFEKELKYSTKYGTIKISKREEEGDEVPKTEKIIEKMKNQPNGIKPEELEKVLKSYGYENVRQKGSHRQYLNKATGDLVTVKQENPLKKVYIIDVLNRIGK